MYAWASAHLWQLANPAFVIPVVVLLGVLLLWSPWPRLGRALATVAAIAWLAIACLPIAAWLTLTLEDRFPPPAPVPEIVTGIVVLGGSVSPGISHLRGLPALNANAERLVEFAVLARRFPDAKLVFAGGGKDLSGRVPTEAAISLQILDRLGLDTRRVLVDDRSTDTYANAVFTKALAQPVEGETWLLVTSAWHMPRAVGAFRAAGWRVVPFPVDYTTAGRVRVSLDFDPVSHLVALDLAVHEWLGLIVYRLLGRSNAFFPAAE